MTPGTIVAVTSNPRTEPTSYADRPHPRSRARAWRSWAVLPALLAFACTSLAPEESEPARAPTSEPAPETLVPQSTPTPPVLAPTSLPAVSALPNPSGVQWSPVHAGLHLPVDLQPDATGRIFLVEQRGVIKLAVGSQIQDTPYLDIQDRVNSSFNEQGLLGLALHPRFSENGFFYAYYTGAGGNTYLSRFQANPLDATADANSEMILLTKDQPFPNHNGGGIAFGPDGYLYISSGDGGSAADPFGNGQSTETLLGKLIRIDVDSADPYAIPPDNPFAGGGGRGEIWAYGLRNPWRFSFDSAGGDLYIGDVGQGEWEEVDYQPAGSAGGANYGWNLREGRHAFASGRTADLVEPVAEYSHDFGCSVTGGVVVRDPALPEWQGVYLYADYCSGNVWGLLRAPDGSWQNELLFQTGFSPSAFGIDLEARVYLIDHQGQSLRLEAAP